MLDAYANKFDAEVDVCNTHIGCSSVLIRRVVEQGIFMSPVEVLGYCAMKVFAFFFQCSYIFVFVIGDKRH